MASTTALFTGLSGLNANSRNIDVLGNNIANVNTFGYKSNRMLFSSMFSRTYSMGTPPSDPAQPGPHYVEFGRWDTKTPLRVSKEYVAGKMTSNDPRVFLIPTGLPGGVIGRLFVCVTAPEEIALHLERDGAEPLNTVINLAKFMR